MIGSAEVKFRKKNNNKHLTIRKQYGFEGIRCNGYSKPSMSEGFPFL